jgi:hypothetical protein
MLCLHQWTDQETEWGAPPFIMERDHATETGTTLLSLLSVMYFNDYYSMEITNNYLWKNLQKWLDSSEITGFGL